MNIGINLSITGTITLTPAPAPEEPEEGPTNLLTNGTFSAAGPPPSINAPGGTATLVISGGKLVFTGGTLGNNLTATWSGLSITSLANYKIVYDASGQAAACSPTFSLGGGSFTTGSGVTGEQSHDKVASASNADFAVRFATSSSGRALSLDNLRLYPALVALTIDYTEDGNYVYENMPIGTVVGTLQGVAAGSSLLLTDASGLFELDGNDILTTAVLDYETATSHNIEVTETLATHYGSPKATPFAITVADGPVLGVLTLDDDTITSATPALGWTGQVFGFGIGILTLTDDEGGTFGLSGSPGGPWILTNLIEITDPAMTLYGIEITETLAYAENSPNATPLTITVD
jgi:hypothetical protein